MKVSIYEESLVGAYDDDDNYYFVIDEEDGTEYIEHTWHHWRPSGVDQGKERITLEQLKKKAPSIYEKAIEAKRTLSNQ